MTDYYTHMDVAMKYAFLVLGKHVHKFFNLEGEYRHDMGTEVITMDKKNLRMDVVYYRSDNIINNIENQTTVVDEEKLKAIAEYAKFLLINHSALVNSYIISKVDPKNCLKEIGLTETLMLRPGYLYMPEEEILQLLNTIKDKIKSNKVLSSMETTSLAMIPTLAQDNISKKVTEDVCYLIEKDKNIDFNVKHEICFIVDIMIDRNISDEKKKQELRKVLKMEEKKSTLQIFLEQETKKLVEDNNDLKKDNNDLKKDNEDLKRDYEDLKRNYEDLKKDNEDLKRDYDDFKKGLIQHSRKEEIIIQNILTNKDMDLNEKASLLNSLILVK